ncbi:MAG: hypothetical protein M3O70_08750 [Actinomycetota bacterium]|nr:hypothetical protein [Actinomycetota bacterium]
MFETDLNQRERRRYAKALRDIARNSERAARALESEDDDKAMIEVVTLGLRGRVVNEITEIFSQAVDVAVAASAIDNENQDFS